MNLSHLEYILAISQAGSISRAARRCHLSQPYLSGILHSMEKELGFPLFERSPQGVILTREGALFMESVHRILAEMEKIRQIGSTQKIQPLEIASYYAPFVMKGFLAFTRSTGSSSPDHIREMGNYKVIQAVRQGQCALGIVFFLNEALTRAHQIMEENNCRYYPLMPPLSLFAVMHRSHPAADRPFLSLAEVFSYPYVSYDDASSREFLRIAGIPAPSHLLEVSDRGSFHDAVNSGCYLSMTASLQKPEEKEMVYLPLAETHLKICSFFITEKNHTLTSREKSFLKFLKSRKTDVRTEQ